MLQGEGICMESLVDMIGLVSVHSTTCNKRGWVYKPNKCDSLIQLEQGKENKQSISRVEFPFNQLVKGQDLYTF